VEISKESMQERLGHTDRGQATRERIVAAAAQLMAERGVAATSLDDVRASTHTSKSQLYHYFGDKHGMVLAVVQYTAGSILRFQAEALDAVETWDDLDRWCDQMVRTLEAHGMRGGCPIGTLAAALADNDEASREELSAAFQTWRQHIAGALRRLQANGLLRADVDLEHLTTTVLAAIQGGLLLGKTMRSGEPLRISLRGAVSLLRGQETAHEPHPS
jgi:TetR/AcrR family transcriptional repressor of nem operon